MITSSPGACATCGSATEVRDPPRSVSQARWSTDAVLQTPSRWCVGWTRSSSRRATCSRAFSPISSTWYGPLSPPRTSDAAAVSRKAPLSQFLFDNKEQLWNITRPLFPLLLCFQHVLPAYQQQLANSQTPDARPRLLQGECAPDPPTYTHTGAALTNGPRPPSVWQAHGGSSAAVGSERAVRAARLLCLQALTSAAVTHSPRIATRSGTRFSRSACAP